MDFESLFHRNSFIPRLTPILCLLCAASFLGLNLVGKTADWDQLKIFGYLPPTSVWQGQPWSLITSTFVHYEIMHVVFNVMLLWQLGNVFEDEFGTAKLALFFLGAAWVSSALQLFIEGNMGIGMSGVGYALFGFGWVARRRVPVFAAILTRQNVGIFLIWLVGCYVATTFGWANIANTAHLAGMLFGAAVAGAFVAKWQPILSAVGVVALIASAEVPLFWCPQSSDWTSIQASEAHERRDYTRALYWYKRTIALDPDDPYATWSLQNMLGIYQLQNDRKNYAATLAQLRAKDPEDAREFEQ